MVNFINLHKQYKSKDSKTIKALDGFSLKINKNEVFALAGVNGAGKTTAFKALFGLIKLDEGKIGFDPSLGDKPQIGFAPEVAELPDYMTVEEVLIASCNLAGKEPFLPSVENAMLLFQLADLRDKKVASLSKGNRQRLSLAAAIVYEPEIIVFDEPTSGLDPLGRNLIKNVIKELKKAGHTIIFSTHMLADLPELCDRMAVIHNGKAVFEGLVSDFCDERSLEALEKSFAKLVGQVV